MESEDWWRVGEGKKYRTNIDLLLKNDDRIDESINYVASNSIIETTLSPMHRDKPSMDLIK